MLRTYYEPYRATASDANSQTTKIIITSSGTTQVTVNYKLRDKWRFKVGGGLTIKNIIFDAIDSLIIYDSSSVSAKSCLASGSACCSYDST